VNNLPKVVTRKWNGRKSNPRPFVLRANTVTITPAGHTQSHTHKNHTTNFDDHFAAGHVALSLGGLLLALMNHAVARRPIFQRKVAHRPAERADFDVAYRRRGVAEILQKLIKPEPAKQQRLN